MVLKPDKQFIEFDQFIIHRMKEWNIPGIAIGIIKNNRLVYSQGYGYRDMNRKIAVEPDTRFLIASCSKSFTATAVGILVDEKKLDWDKPVKKYLPTFATLDPMITQRMTPRDLLSHRSGLPRHDNLWFNNPISKKELEKRLKYVEPTAAAADIPYDFRNKFQYNNNTFIIAGLLIEHLTGQTFEQFVQDRIFDKVEMSKTTFLSDKVVNDPEFPISYTRNKNRLYPRLSGWMKHENIVQLLGPGSPAGGIVSNIPDLSRWIILQMRQGKIRDQRIISESNLKELHTQQYIVQPPSEYPERLNQCYGLGWFVETYRGYRLIRHSGNLSGFSAYLGFMPKEKMGVVMLSNVGSSPLDPMIPFYIYDQLLGLPVVDWNRRKKLETKKEEHDARLKLRKDFKHKPGTKPSRPLPAYAGIYQHAGYGKVIITFENGKLRLNFNGALYQLIHLEKDSFKMIEQFPNGDKYKVIFSLTKTQNIESIGIPFEPAVKDIVFEKKG
jgi:CubicO group peptidase (beta-lactamase class C family)